MLSSFLLSNSFTNIKDAVEDAVRKTRRIVNDKTQEARIDRLLHKPRILQSIEHG